MKKRLLLALLFTSGLMSAAAPPTDQLRVYEETVRNSDGRKQLDALKAAARLKIQLKQYDYAVLDYQKIYAHAAASAADRSEAQAELANLYQVHLREFPRAVQAARELSRLPGVTPKQRKQAETVIEQCRTRESTPRLLPDERPAAEALARKVRADHPRMYLNAETLPLIRRHIERPDIKPYYLEHVKKFADAAPADPQLHSGEKGQTKTAAGKYVQVDRPNFYGAEAACAAFVYLLENDPAYRDKGIKLLLHTVPALEESFRVGVLPGGDYYNSTVLYAMAAYDWLYNDLTPEQRKSVGGALLCYTWRALQEDGKRFVTVNDPVGASGFYGTRMLKLYGGLLALHDGIDDELALKQFYDGYRDHLVMLNARDQATGDDGGFVSTANNYVMSSYLWTPFNFLSAMHSATGIDLAPNVAHLKYYPQWCNWSTLNGRDQLILPGTAWERIVRRHDFGIGDTGNTLKNAPNVDMQMLEVLHFLPDDPQLRRQALGMVTGKPGDFKNPNRYRRLAPVLYYRLPPIPEEGLPPAELKSHARVFENLGVVFLRSGSGRLDTYAAFVTNKKIAAHRHYDANSFQIYKYDFLALDTGTRIGFDRNDYEQLNAYYAQTVAHNTVLIHMPEEEMPYYWVTPKKRLEYYSHGGQFKTVGDHCAAFETNDFYTYIAGDATATYRAEKCLLALRQFVFIYPDYFVIADRVTSARPEYRKEWLLHVQNEPVFDDERTFHADDGGGRLFCRSLLPRGGKLTAVGGPGQEFLASGRNWELPKEAKKYAETKNYLGRYRVEAAPADAAAETVFLHVIQVGKDTLPRMVETKLLEDGDCFGVSFGTERGEWEVRFNRSGAPGGAIKLTKEGKILLDQPFRQNVQPQSGLD